MLLAIIFVVVMLLWFLSLLPAARPHGEYTGWLAFIAVLILALHVFGKTLGV